MSRIAALLVLYAAPASSPALTADQVLAAHRSRTGIGRDPCRAPASDEEIVVCARRENPYALPLYDPDAGGAASTAGGARGRLAGELADTQGACASQSAQCRPAAAVNLLQVVRGATRIVEALRDDE